MGKRSWQGMSAAFLLTGISITWVPFSSKLYPYTISQPSSFRHDVIVTATGHKVDYFFPALTGSFTTNVHISCQPRQAGAVEDAVRYLRGRDATHVHKVGVLTVMGRREGLIRARFTGLTGQWTEEEVTFSSGGYTWRLTASYDTRFRSLRSTMLRMLASFQAH